MRVKTGHGSHDDAISGQYDQRNHQRACVQKTKKKKRDNLSHEPARRSVSRARAQRARSSASVLPYHRVFDSQIVPDRHSRTNATVLGAAASPTPEIQPPRETCLQAFAAAPGLSSSNRRRRCVVHHTARAPLTIDSLRPAEQAGDNGRPVPSVSWRRARVANGRNQRQQIEHPIISSRPLA